MAGRKMTANRLSRRWRRWRRRLGKLIRPSAQETQYVRPITGIKLAAVSAVRNERAIIEFNIWHHLNQGCDCFLVMDNGSSDGTLEILERLMTIDQRVVVYSRPGEFHQASMLTFLAREAHRLGCDWVVPVDADEYWLSPNGLKEDLSTIGAPAVRVTLENFVQSSSKVSDAETVYDTVNWRVPGSIANAIQSEIEEGRRSMLEFPWTKKFIIRCTETLSIAAGAHQFSGGATGRSVSDSKFTAYHVPFRSYAALVQKAESGRRLIAAGYPANHGWESQRWARLDDRGELPGEWLALSESDGALTLRDRTVPLERDDSVRNLFNEFRGNR